jgi:formamidopyrimidine-DNA glycosylase
MTGQLVFVGQERFGAGHPSESLIGELPDRSTRVIISFTDGSKLFFNDQRKFGWMRLIPTPEVMQLDFFQKVGPEPLAADFTWEQFRDRLMRRPKTNIKAALLDQTVIAGVGNIYADESLWGAQLHPLTLIQSLKPAQFRRLYEELVFVLKLSIEKGGSTDRNYVNAEGKKGSYIDFARVFRREGKACSRCGSIISKTRVAGRGTHLCPHCQKEPK